MLCPPRDFLKRLKAGSGFTLAEILIALGLLGAIAAFTIPKILNSSTAAANNAKAKEVAGMISEAYQAYQQTNTPTAATKPSDLIPYMNYVSLITDGTQIDAHPGAASWTCSATTPCLRLHNGGIIVFNDPNTVGGTASNYGVEFAFDPDGTYSGSTSDSSGKAVQFVLYYNGLLRTRGRVRSDTCVSSGCYGPNPAYDPSWFSW